VNTYDPNLHEQRRKLEALEARLARHERTTRTILILVTVLAAVALGLLLKTIL
jgi:fatty acid desaturase